MTLGSEEGFVRVTARADNYLVLRIQAIRSAVSELSAAFDLSRCARAGQRMRAVIPSFDLT